MEQVILRAALAVGEEDFAAVIMHLRIAHAAPRILQQRGRFAGVEIQPAKLRAFPPGLAVGDHERNSRSSHTNARRWGLACARKKRRP